MTAEAAAAFAQAATADKMTLLYEMEVTQLPGLCDRYWQRALGLLNAGFSRQ